MNDLFQEQIMCGAGSDILPADRKSAWPRFGAVSCTVRAVERIYLFFCVAAHRSCQQSMYSRLSCSQSFCLLKPAASTVRVGTMIRTCGLSLEGAAFYLHGMP